MIRMLMVLAVACGFGLMVGGCTNTVRGLGEDLHSNTLQNYNHVQTATDLDY